MTSYQAFSGCHGAVPKLIPRWRLPRHLGSWESQVASLSLPSDRSHLKTEVTMFIVFQCFMECMQ